MDLPLPGLLGRHQLANAAAAIQAVRTAGFNVPEYAVETAMTTVEWPARMQRLIKGKLVDLAVPGSEIWLDGGHNPGAGLVIAEAIATLEDRSQRPLFLITGMINTKDPVGYFQAFTGMARHVYTVPIRSSGAGIPHDELALAANEAGLSAEPVHSVENALKILRDSWDKSEPAPRILIGGSLYLAGDVLSDNGTPPAIDCSGQQKARHRAGLLMFRMLEANQAAEFLIQSVNLLLGAAPTRLAASSPSLNISKVGIERTPNWAASSGFSSILTLAIVTLPSISEAISSRAGRSSCTGRTIPPRNQRRQAGLTELHRTGNCWCRS